MLLPAEYRKITKSILITDYIVHVHDKVKFSQKEYGAF